VTLQLRYLWERLRTSYWFLPALMLLAAAGLAWSAIYADARIGFRDPEGLAWALVVSSEGATAVMSTVAGSMVTIAGVVFSITLVALSLASGQFGPRMLRNFIRDRVNQTALGAFLATFLYCLLVLSAIRHGPPTEAFVPQLAVGLGVVLAIASVATLILYIHHVAVTIQADTLIENIYRDLCSLMDELYPDILAQGEEETPSRLPTDRPHGFDQVPAIVPAPCHAYVQAVDRMQLLTLAREHELVIRLERKPGQYALEGAALMSVWPARGIDDTLCARLQAQVVFGAQRTATQDVEFALDQLVEIAARALSPGINDPFTAITCVDRLSSALARLAGRRLPPCWHADDRGVARLHDCPVGFAAALDAAFNPIRQAARGNAHVMIHMMDSLDQLERLCRREPDRQAIGRHAEMLLRAAASALSEPRDRRELGRRHRTLSGRLVQRQPGARLVSDERTG